MRYRIIRLRDVTYVPSHADRYEHANDDFTLWTPLPMYYTLHSDDAIPLLS